MIHTLTALALLALFYLIGRLGNKIYIIETKPEPEDNYPRQKWDVPTNWPHVDEKGDIDPDN